MESLYTCQCEGLHMGQRSGVPLKEVRGCISEVFIYIFILYIQYILCLYIFRTFTLQIPLRIPVTIDLLLQDL